MAVDLTGLVRFSGEDNASVRAAVEWVASKPEGMELLREARKLHGKPLEIITDSSIYNLGYGDMEENHVVYVNPSVVEGMKVVGEHGEPVHMSLQRFFFHELVHATQPNVIPPSIDYAIRKQEIQNECMQSLVHIPMENYTHRISAAKGDTALRSLFSEIYDAHVAGPIKKLWPLFMQKASQDEIVKNFIQKYENPAVDFENRMAAKYLGAAARTIDYAQSGSYDALVNKNGFIDSAVASCNATRAAVAATKASRDPREIRPDAGAKAQGTAEIS